MQYRQRQKSFFSKDRPAQNAGKSWQPKTEANEFIGQNRSSKPGNSKPPIKPSLESKSKLKSFAFAAPMDPQDDHNAVEGNDKENGPTIGSPESPFETMKTPRSRKKIETLVKDVPKTPVGRLALAELLREANGEPAPEAIAEQTQLERIVWENTKAVFDPSQPSSLLPLTKRGKKRARSSSPLSSPNQAPSFHPTESQAFDFQPLQNSLKAANNTSGHTATGTNFFDKGYGNTSNKPPPNLAHLFETSSPRPLEETSAKRAGSSFSRSISCGMDWPTSASKRRKTTKSSLRLFREHSTPAVYFNQEDAQEKKSRVTLLMEQVQDSLCRAPLKKKSDKENTRPIPTEPSNQVRTVPRDQSTHGSEVNTGLPDLTEQQTEVLSEPPAVKSSTSSDYGDIDDDELLHAVEIPVATNVAPSDTGRSERTPASNITAATDREAQALQNQKSGLKSELATDQSVTDEYDLGENFEDDIEEMMVQHEQKQSSHSRGAETQSVGKQAPGCKQPSTSASRNDSNDYSGDEYGTLEDDDLKYVSSLSGTGPAVLSQDQVSRASKSIKRYLITDIANGSYKDARGKEKDEVVLAVQEEGSKTAKVILLRQSWIHTPCTIGAFVHLIGDFSPLGMSTVDDDHGMLILHPDHLISATVVADSFTCSRRAVLQDRVKATNAASKSQVYGQILHELFQEAMRRNSWDEMALANMVESIAGNFIDSIYEIRLSLHEAIAELKNKIPEMTKWGEAFVSAKPKSSAYMRDTSGNAVNVSINKLLDVEEHVWSPKYGLKGNIDATVQVVAKDSTGSRTLTVPLEMKTGQKNAASQQAHMAQTALYTLLLSDRYDIDVIYGVLYYLESPELTQVPAMRREIRGMIMQRNELACYVRERLKLPPMLKNQFTCDKCYAKTPCFLYHKLVDGGDGDTSGLKEKFNEIVGHLEPSHQDFFKKWDDLLTKEERDILKFRRELWTMTSTEREKVARCFANVVIEPGSAKEYPKAPKVHRYEYTLIKAKSSPTFSFIESQITVGEPIVISDEEGHFALANGYVMNISKKRIKVTVDRRLHNARTKQKGFDETTNQVFAGIMEVSKDGSPPSTYGSQQPDSTVVYRLDKDEFSNGMSLARNNLLQLMIKDSFKSSDLRDIIVNLRPPRFKPAPSPYQVPDDAALNGDQKNAIEKVLSAEDYALVLGMPGTGKTTTTAHIIRALISRGKSVLLTSYTHTAVDNILLKIKNDKLRVLRLGAVTKIHPEVQNFADLAGRPKRSVEEITESYQKSDIVATTCLGINHTIFNERIFDYCIVDEASQITLPVCLGPIRMAKTFILVGDHYQLPPLVQNKDAREGGLDISLFKLLSETHPNTVANLEHQYRMCEDVMKLSNSLIYHGMLKCGNDEVAARTMVMPNPAGLKCYHHTPSSLGSTPRDFCLGPNSGNCWIQQLLEPSRKSCFVNTDALGELSHEFEKGKRITNLAEAALCNQLVRFLLATGVQGSDIGVITCYRSQLSVLRHSLRDITNTVEMHTADKFQGRDKEIIIVSLVRSNESRNVGELLRDWRRVNVSFTRAKSKMLILGSRSTIEGDPLLRKFVQLMDSNNWTYDLPENALTAHAFEETVTQADPSSVFIPSPLKQKLEGSQKRAKGPKKGHVDIERLLDKRQVLKDVMNEVIG